MKQPLIVIAKQTLSGNWSLLNGIGWSLGASGIQGIKVISPARAAWITPLCRITHPPSIYYTKKVCAGAVLEPSLCWGSPGTSIEIWCDMTDMLFFRPPITDRSKLLWQGGRISSEINENGFTMSDRSNFPPDFQWNVTISFFSVFRAVPFGRKQKMLTPPPTWIFFQKCFDPPPHGFSLNCTIFPKFDPPSNMDFFSNFFFTSPQHGFSYAHKMPNGTALSDRNVITIIFGTGKFQFIQIVLMLKYWNLPWAMPRHMRVCIPNLMTIGEIVSEIAGMKNCRDRKGFSSVSMSLYRPYR